MQSTTGQMDAKVWWRMWWTDERLSWNESDYGGITKVQFNAASFALPEDSEIWLPDVQPYNIIPGMTSAFDAALATVVERFRLFDCKRAKCFREEERQHLLSVIENGFGDLEVFNSVVRHLFTNRLEGGDGATQRSATRLRPSPAPPHPTKHTLP